MLENLWFSDIFRGYRKGKSAWNGLNLISEKASYVYVLALKIREKTRNGKAEN